MVENYDKLIFSKSFYNSFIIEKDAISNSKYGLNIMFNYDDESIKYYLEFVELFENQSTVSSDELIYKEGTLQANFNWDHILIKYDH